jgi:hypothetical protein
MQLSQIVVWGTRRNGQFGRTRGSGSYSFSHAGKAADLDCQNFGETFSDPDQALSEQVLLRGGNKRLYERW